MELSKQMESTMLHFFGRDIAYTLTMHGIGTRR